MRNYEAEKLKKIIQQKETAMVAQVKETDGLRRENMILKAQLTQESKDAYNKAIQDAVNQVDRVAFDHISICFLKGYILKLLKQ